jgi:hypothetical protein
MFALVAMVSCADGGARECFEHSECASGFCRDDGTCAPVEPDAGSGDADPSIDSSDQSDGGAYCQPNHDGTITRDEVLMAAGKSATFRVAVDTDVDTAGELQTGGDRIWDLTGALTGDDDIEINLLSLADTWFEDLFPGASYTTRLSQSEELLGVFELTDTRLLLRGVVSPEAGIYRTELTYDPPATILEFPITSSSSWSSTSTVSGLASGVYSYYTEEYQSQVDAIGTLSTPFGDFPVQRVRVELDRLVGTVPVNLRSFSFLSECYGTVATITSDEYESEVDFTHAAEVRRLAP